MKNRINWNPDIYKCIHCNTEVYSKYPGDWVPCSCFENKEDNKGGYVDQTREYVRIGGGLVWTGRKLHDS